MLEVFDTPACLKVLGSDFPTADLWPILYLGREGLRKKISFSGHLFLESSYGFLFRDKLHTLFKNYATIMGPTKAEGEGERAEKREEQVKSMQVVTNLSSLKQNED